MLVTFFKLLAFVPLPVLHSVGRTLGRFVYFMPGRYRERLRANAAQAGYTSAAFARQAAAETGAMMLELPQIWFRGDESLAKVDSTEVDELLRIVRHEKRPILFMTPHLGCFEITARFLAQTQTITVMFRPPRKAILEPLMRFARNAANVQAVPASTEGVRAFLKALRAKQQVGLLPDQAPKSGDGVWAPFFGRPAYTITLPGKLAATTGAIVVMISAERLPRGQGWRLHALRATEPLPEQDIGRATYFNNMMETLIKQCPEQYLWGYNRYKIPKLAPPITDMHQE